MECFSLYFVKLDVWKIYYPSSREDVGHPDYFKDVVAEVLADYHDISKVAIHNLCYSQVRGRFATSKQVKRLSPREIKLRKKKGLPIPNGKTIYIGEDLEQLPEVKALLEEHFPDVVVKFDDHHQRQADDVAQFESIVQDQRLRSL